MGVAAHLEERQPHADATAHLDAEFGAGAGILAAIDEVSGLVIEHVEAIGQRHQFAGFDQARQTGEVVAEHRGTDVRRDAGAHLQIYQRRRVDGTDRPPEAPAGGEALDLQADQIQLVAAGGLRAHQQIDQPRGGVGKIEEGEGDFRAADVGRTEVVGIGPHTAIAEGAGEGVHRILENALRRIGVGDGVAVLAIDAVGPEWIGIATGIRTAVSGSGHDRVQIRGQEQPGGDDELIGILEAGNGIDHLVDVVVEIHPAGDGAIGIAINADIDQIMQAAIAEQIEAGDRELRLENVHQRLQWIEEVLVQELGDLDEGTAGRHQILSEVDLDLTGPEYEGSEREIEPRITEFAIATKQHLAIDADGATQGSGDLGIDLEAHLGQRVELQLADVR